MGPETSAGAQAHPTQESSRTKAKASPVTSVPTLQPEALHLAPDNQVTAALMHVWLCVHRCVERVGLCTQMCRWGKRRGWRNRILSVCVCGGV